MTIANLFTGFNKLDAKAKQKFLKDRIKTDAEFFKSVELLPKKFNYSPFCKRFNPMHAERVMYELSKLLTNEDFAMMEEETETIVENKPTVEKTTETDTKEESETDGVTMADDEESDEETEEKNDKESEPEGMTEEEIEETMYSKNEPKDKKKTSRKR